MRVEQISIFLENKAGRLAEVTAILKDANVNIRASSLADTTDFGILRLIVNNNQVAKDALKKEGFTVGVTDVVAIKVDDTPGGLNHVLNPLTVEGINVEYMYAFASTSGNDAIMIFRFDDLERAISILKEKSIKIINGEDVYNL